MHIRGTRRPSIGVLAAVVVPAFALAGCSSTIDSGKAEQLIRQDIAGGSGAAKVTSVSCPSDVTAKAGGTFTCKLSIRAGDGSLHSGTVTLHMTDSSGHVTINRSDFNVQ
jgi:hypothetical protein